MGDVVSALREALGDRAVLEGETGGGAPDWLGGARRTPALAVLRPASTEEVSTALRICHAHRQPVVPQGGLTGLVHGADTNERTLALSLERMHAIEAVDPVNRTMTVQAGVPLQRVQEAADEHDLLFPLDLGARGSATIGGNIATNAGGNRVIRYGMMRENVLGLEAVLADGTVVSSLHPMLKNNTGYDLKQLFVGSEGTLGVVTRAVLRLRQKPRSENAAFVAVPDFDRVTALLARVDAELGGMLSAFEVLWDDFYRLITTPPAENRPPFATRSAFYVLIEALGGDEAADAERFQTVLARALEDGLVVDAAVATSAADRARLWAMRDDVGQVRRHAPVQTFDVSLPIPAVPVYVEEVNARLGERFGEVVNFVFGHLGDGNIHLIVGPGDREPETRQAVEAIVYGALAPRGGSVSAEHGIGLEKKPWLAVSRSEAEQAVMRAVKQALDPERILNPGKIL
jgi:FAD/FMN-containing dehydrogenase